MKKISFILIAILVITAGLFAFKAPWAGSIKGIVVPTDGAKIVWALSATDTLKANIIQGSFEIADVKPGNYRVVIEATLPYKNAVKENVQVAEGMSADAGTFILMR